MSLIPLRNTYVDNFVINTDDVRYAHIDYSSEEEHSVTKTSIMINTRQRHYLKDSFTSVIKKISKDPDFIKVGYGEFICLPAVNYIKDKKDPLNRMTFNFLKTTQGSVSDLNVYNPPIKSILKKMKDLNKTDTFSVNCRINGKIYFQNNNLKNIYKITIEEYEELKLDKALTHYSSFIDGSRLYISEDLDGKASLIDLWNQYQKTLEILSSL